MRRSGKLTVCAIGVLMTAALVVPAMAHGHHGHHSQTASYPQCQEETCQLTYQHCHDGVTYCGHTRGDGHSQHIACDVAGCTTLGTHTHRSGGHCGHHH